MPATTYHHTHKGSAFANFLYQTSLVALIFLAACVCLASGYDIVQQVISTSRGKIRFSDTSITAGAYLLFALVALVISFSRLWTVRKVLSTIPKGYIPVGKDDLNKNIYRVVTSEYTRGAMIMNLCQPTGRTLPGWGDPDGDYAGIRFRTAILETVQVLDKAVPASYLADQSESSRFNPPSKSLRVSLLAKYIPLTQGEDPILPKSLTPVLVLYEKHLEDARWKREEPTQAQYEDCLRIVALLVSLLSQRLLMKKQESRDRSLGFTNTYTTSDG